MFLYFYDSFLDKVKAAKESMDIPCNFIPKVMLKYSPPCILRMCVAPTMVCIKLPEPTFEFS